MKVLENLANAEFLDSEEMSGCDALPPPSCDAGPLPPGCDCICHTPCDFGRLANNYSAGEDSNILKNRGGL